MSGGSESVESAASRACREYHERTAMAAGLVDRRTALADFARTYYEERIGVPLTEGIRRAADGLSNPGTLAVEIAHDGQLPHLGIVRMVVKSEAVARADGRGVVLYLVGTHYAPVMRPDNIHYGMPLREHLPEAVKQPPKFRIGRANAHTPFRWLPPPARADLESLERQLGDFVANNVDHEWKRGRPVSKDATLEIMDRLHRQFTMLARAAGAVRNFGDWLVRVQYELLHEILGERADRIILLPMADITDLFRDELEQVARDPSAPMFWLHCPACKRRIRHAWNPAAVVDFICPACRHAESLLPEQAWRWLMPGIIAYEVGLFRLGIDGWLVGSHADYHPKIERAYDRLHHRPMPPKFFLTSAPWFRGIGEPESGHTRARLLRVLLEVDGAALGAALDGPWEELPHIVSPFLGGC